jgi:tetratricopeptide (TPR) repeat protein
MRYFISTLSSITIIASLLSGHSFNLRTDRFSNGIQLNRNDNDIWCLHDNLRKSITAAEQERREEDKRRRERIADVVPGKTSAISGAKDYAIDVDSTREQWMRQASQVEQEVYRMTELGMDMVRMLRLDQALIAFNRVFELKPNAYLWQAGIVKFYLSDLDGAAEIFSRCGTIYETRFGELASEERIWRNASLLKKLSVVNRKDRKNLEKNGSRENVVTNILPNVNFDCDSKIEKRRVVRIALKLFQSSVDGDLATTILARSQLRLIGGTFSDLTPTMDKKLWKISSWYYLGLHYDVLGEYEASKICMKAALRLRPNANSNDLIHILPMLHMTCRNWYDDEAFEITSSSNGTKFIQDVKADGLRDSLGEPYGVDPIVCESIRSSLEKLRIIDLQEVLRTRRLRVIGSKLELQKRLFDSLIADADALL